MCIIITGAAANIRRVLFNTPGLIESIYKNNPHGLGVMFMGGCGYPLAFKTLPKTIGEVKSFLQDHLPVDDRPAALHARWTTHGDTDMGNCHPYELGGGYLMHNGVLHTGNAADVHKSDTWHYIKNFLGDGACLLAPHTQRLVSSHISEGNRFVYLAPSGEMVHINKHTGVEYEGLWFANTYAWNVSLLDPKWGGFGGKGGGRKRGKRSRRVWLGDGFATDYLAEAHDYFEPSKLNEWRDDEGNLDWLLGAHEEYLADVLHVIGVDAIRELVEEFGSPWVTYSKGRKTGADELTRAAYCLEERDYSSLAQMLAEGKAEVIAQAAIYEVSWPELDYDESDTGIAYDYDEEVPAAIQTTSSLTNATMKTTITHEWSGNYAHA